VVSSISEQLDNEPPVGESDELLDTLFVEARRAICGECDMLEQRIRTEQPLQPVLDIGTLGLRVRSLAQKLGNSNTLRIDPERCRWPLEASVTGTQITLAFHQQGSVHLHAPWRERTIPLHGGETWMFWEVHYIDTLIRGSLPQRIGVPRSEVIKDYERGMLAAFKSNSAIASNALANAHRSTIESLSLA